MAKKVEVTEPVEPVEPVKPTEPVEPVEPTEPAEPTEPIEPIEPTEPAEPTEPVILNPEIYDENGVSWENRAKERDEWHEKFLKERDKNVAVQSPQNTKLDDVEINEATFIEDEWLKIEDKRGVDRKLIIMEHNLNVKSKKIDVKLEQIESKTVKSEIMAKVEPEYINSVNEYITKMKINESDKEAMESAVEMVYAALKGTKVDMNKIQENVKKDMETKKRMLAAQPGPSTPPIPKKLEKGLNEEEKYVAKQWNISEKEWNENK